MKTLGLFRSIVVRVPFDTQFDGNLVSLPPFAFALSAQHLVNLVARIVMLESPFGDGDAALNEFGADLLRGAGVLLHIVLTVQIVLKKTKIYKTLQM